MVTGDVLLVRRDNSVDNTSCDQALSRQRNLGRKTCEGLIRWGDLLAVSL